MRYVQDTVRLRGRAGVEQRARRLAVEPLCRSCTAKGRTTAATVPDHIVPISMGGTDDGDNIQCLCDDCHAIKTAIEGAAFEGAATHPEWLEPSAIPLTILCGPPCSGKTTYIAQHAASFDTIIDLDTIAQSIRPTYRHWTGDMDSALLNKAIRARNAMLGALARTRSGKAWFIVAAPTEGERAWWRDKLGAVIILLHPGAEECKRRAITRGTPKAIIGIDDWEDRATRQWQRPSHRRQTIACDEAGWPATG